MASNNYNAYGYQNYQQQRSAQQYSGYQTATAANTVPPQSRTAYQQAPSAAASESTDYMPYSAQTYSNQGDGYGERQDNTWAGNTSYGGNGGSTRGAAEVLRNMSNSVAYGTSTTASISQPGFTATKAPAANSARYPNKYPTQHAQSSHTGYGQTTQSQQRPRSVNATRPQATSNSGNLFPAMAAGHPSQRAQTMYNQQSQQSASPAQLQYGHSATTSAGSTRTAAVNSAAQYEDYGHRQLPAVNTSRNRRSTSIPTPYSYADAQVSTPVTQPTAAANIAEQYSHGMITVDPSAVYDPWLEYQRQQEKLREQKATEDSARAEEERKAEEARQEQERKEEETAGQAALPTLKNAQPDKAQKEQSTASDAGLANLGSVGEGVDALESEIRAMMAKMRELNSKDPALLARIWEEERRVKVPKSPTIQSKTTHQPAATQPVQAGVPSTTNQRKKAAPKGTTGASSARPQAHIPAQPVAKPQAQRVAVPSSYRPPPRTNIWPPEKKAQVAEAAAAYLNGQNPSNPVTPDRIFSILDGNPSYLELCEQLEAMSLKLDRAAFAKTILTAVPDVNSASRSQAQVQAQARSSARTTVSQVNSSVRAPPARMEVATPMAASPAIQPPFNRSPCPPVPNTGASVSHSPVPVAEMLVIKPESKLPANKEEAARKRNFNDLIDLTADLEDDVEPMLKKQYVAPMPFYTTSRLPSGNNFDDLMHIDGSSAPVTNFPISRVMSTAPSLQFDAPSPFPQLPPYPRALSLAQPLDKKKALRRNGYNIKTIARDILLACGRHPEERQLNAHLEILKSSLAPHITNDSDLSTLRWDLIDPGQPPRGYWRDTVQTLAEDADDENDSDEEDSRRGAPRLPVAHVIGGGVGLEARAQALPATNPFQQKKRRGRPPRNSYPNNGLAETPQRSTESSNMSASAPRPTATSMGYSAFKSASQYGPDGNPLPKKRGRPVGWRKAIHGSADAKSKPNANRHTGSLSAPSSANRSTPIQPSGVQNVTSSTRGDGEVIMIRSRSPSVVKKAPRYQSFKCKWQNCKAELHNLDTLKKHVHKVHMKETPRSTLECLWGDCGRKVTNVHTGSGMVFSKHSHFSFMEVGKWREHLELRHFSPLSWEMGDGPASGVSG